MAPKQKSQNSATATIPPIDPNNQLSFTGNHMSVVSKSDLLHLVSVGVLPPKELCSWRICRGVTVPTEDTHESVIYIPFCLGLVLKCYELRTRQHEILNVNALRPLKHYSLKDLMHFGQRLKTIQLRRSNLCN
jgi:hypothetical protein